MDVKLPSNIPKTGFYYHFKHDQQGEVNNYAYEVVGLGVHIETGELQVEYRPLYYSSLAYGLRINYHRHLSMFMGEVMVGDVKKPRFKRVEDMSVIAKLLKFRNRMYPKTAC